MKYIHNRKAFGFWEGMPYGEVTDNPEEFENYKNSISKEAVIRHIESLGAWISSVRSYDMFTGEDFNSGFYEDGEFTFPVDFFRYYKKCDIGIPPEYEAYLKEILE